MLGLEVALLAIIGFAAEERIEGVSGAPLEFYKEDFPSLLVTCDYEPLGNFD